jgi:ribokinase
MATIVVLGIFVADLAFLAPRLPVMGETILGERFRIGPGGKGSNQSIAAARAGGNVALITRVGRDPFAEIARTYWSTDGVDTLAVIEDPNEATGAAFIFVSTTSGDNAIIVSAGAAGKLSPGDVEAAKLTITGAKVFMTQFEQPIETAIAALTIARNAGVTTILNPAPAAKVDDAIFALCDYVTPNETEAAALTGLPVTNEDEALLAARDLVRRGAKNVLMTLGANGALLHGADGTHKVPGFKVPKVVDTTGAGDAFGGGFAVALSEGKSPVEAVRFGCATAAFSVQREGTAPSMPTRAEIEEMLKG